MTEKSNPENDLTNISFAEQVLRIISNTPHDWANGEWKGKKHNAFMHPLLGGFIIKWPYRVKHMGVMRNWIGSDEERENHMRLHCRSLSPIEQIRIYRAYQQWKRRSLDLNKLPLDQRPGEIISIYGP